MGRLILIISLLCSAMLGKAQDTAFQLRLQHSVPGIFTDFSVDETGNIYLVLNGSQLKKLNRNGDSVAVFNDVKRYGKIHSIDVSNPFKILVYYKATATIVILDRFLAIQQVADLRKNNIFRVTAVRLSYDNNIWLYDEMNSRIKKIDANGKLLMQSADLRNVFPQPVSFQSIFDADRTLSLYDSLQGLFVFDYYGAYLKKYAFPGWKDVQVFNHFFTGRSDSCIVVANNNDFNYSKRFCGLFVNALKVQHSLKQTYVLYNDRLEIYGAL